MEKVVLEKTGSVRISMDYKEGKENSMSPKPLKWSEKMVTQQGAFKKQGIKYNS